MNEKLDQDLDELLSRHLGACLDGQLGRAAAAFAAERAPRRSRWRLGMLAGASVAAGLAAAWLILGNRLSPDKKISTGGEVVQSDPESMPPMVQSATWSRMKDDGLAVLDDQPVRQLHRQIVEEVEWYDAKTGATVKTRMPRQQIILIGLRTD
jgi:hypothetical protein